MVASNYSCIRPVPRCIPMSRYCIVTAGGLMRLQAGYCCLYYSCKRTIGEVLTITEKTPTRFFYWLKAPTSAFTFKTLLRHYAKRALTPRSLNVKLGP